jgi:membrane-associated PAP2 superfamily phosphatase
MMMIIIGLWRSERIIILLNRRRHHRRIGLLMHRYVKLLVVYLRLRILHILLLMRRNERLNSLLLTILIWLVLFISQNCLVFIETIRCLFKIYDLVNYI